MKDGGETLRDKKVKDADEILRGKKVKDGDETLRGIGQEKKNKKKTLSRVTVNCLTQFTTIRWSR